MISARPSLLARSLEGGCGACNLTTPASKSLKINLQFSCDSSFLSGYTTAQLHHLLRNPSAVLCPTEPRTSGRVLSLDSCSSRYVPSQKLISPSGTSPSCMHAVAYIYSLRGDYPSGSAQCESFEPPASYQLSIPYLLTYNFSVNSL